MKKNLHLFFILLTLNCFAQFSKTHYIPPLISSSGLVSDHYLYISTPSLVNVNFKIIANGGGVINGTVNSTKPYIYYIGTGANTQLFTPLTMTGIIANKGYIIEAEDLIYVSVRVNAGVNNTGGYNHAGGLVSKGNSALGTTFRLGAMLNPLFDQSLLNFASILATENGTKVTISDLKSGARILNRSSTNTTFTITLNKNESFVMPLENYSDGDPVSNSSKMIGALVKSDKPVVVNSGSFGGSNSSEVRVQNNVITPTGRDVGFDQIVPLEKTGKEYIFVKGIGTDELERVLLVAHYDQTKIFLNGDTTPITTLNSGEYIALDGSQFINDNMYITASQNLFAYQSIGGLASPANQNLFFVPPINCSTPNAVDNIPEIQSIGNTIFNGFLNIVTETGATVLLNNSPIAATPTTITGNPNFVRYTIGNLLGNIAVKSTKQVYVSYFGTNGAATYGGYYSGFDLKPEIVSGKISITDNSSWIPNVSLKINTLSSYDTFQWFKDDILIPSETNNNYKPTQPGFYQVRGSISGCVSDVYSDKIPVSIRPINIDNDLANDNIDIDYDNDGILNCTESFGSKSIDNSNPNSGIVTAGTYSNSFTGSFSNTTPEAAIPFQGNTDGSFVTEVMAGKGLSVAYNLNFTKPINLSLEYPSTANTTDLLNTDSEYIINSDIDKTITVLNPTDQLLIDTNYDGVYESGVTQFSSFEIRFRLNGNIPLAAGSGTFSFQSYQTKTFKITHKNLLDTAGNKATFKLTATCLPNDTDGDGIPDQLDLDSDNDGIPDSMENQKIPKPLSNTDTNLDGLDNLFDSATSPLDSDNDGVPNYLDLDSDNDGIYDLVESGSNALDSNKDGILDTAAFGTNGLANILETSPDNGVLSYSVADTDGDGIKNQTEMDSDNDLCNDVIEAGFLDADGDGILGSQVPATVNAKGKVTSGTGYNTPNSNYILFAPIVITAQPTSNPVCELQNAKITLTDNGGNTYQWQLSTDGVNWSNLVNNSTYLDVATNTLTIVKVTTIMSNYKYRVQLNKTGNSCGLTSAETSLSIYALPVISDATLIQCDDDSDGISNFNVTEKNSFISTNYTNETFSYYTTLNGANTKDATALITNPIAFTSANSTIWSRVENSNGCFRVAQLTLIVSTTQPNAAFKKTIEVCDDFVDAVNDDRDGIATFDFSSVTADIKSLLPPPSTNYMIKFYSNKDDALAETNAIQNPSNYRNTIPNQQEIWVRIESNLDNACFVLGSYITLIVNPKPHVDTNANKKDNELICSNLPTFSITLNAGIIDNTPINSYNYIWLKDGMTIPNENGYTLDVNEEGNYSVIVSTSKGCDRTRNINVTASDIAHLNTVSILDLSDSNTVTANITGQGDYQYSLDLPNGPFQDSNFFENVPSGIHDLYINDKNGCGIIKKNIAVLGIPKFFTPNNDGYNDYWKIKGTSETFNSHTQIFIYDRYAKLIKQITASGNGWDGTYVGNPMPADDYWYTIKLEDGREAKGHFALKR